MKTEYTLSSAGNAEIKAKLKPLKANSHSITTPTLTHRAGSDSVQQAIMKHKLRVALIPKCYLEIGKRNDIKQHYNIGRLKRVLE